MFYLQARKAIGRGWTLFRRALFCALLAFPGAASAQEAACDAEIMDSIRAKALLEANVETVTNQNLMTKPDSVFEYSCFDFYVIQTATAVGPSASETEVFGMVPGHDPLSLDRGLQATIMDALAEYLFANYFHVFLGGRAIPADIDAHLTTDCSTMRAVWWRAKCANFLEAEHDGFFSYDQHADYDVRQLPMPCETPPDWLALIDLAILDPPWWQEYVQETATIYELIFLRLQPGVCAPPTSSAHVMVQTYPEGEFADAVCTNPGCRYDGGGCVGL